MTWRDDVTPLQIFVGVVLASTSGAAIIANAFWDVPLRFTAGAIVFPAAVFLTGAILLAQRRRTRLHAFGRILGIGLVWGLMATIAYDLVRPLLITIFGLDFRPYRAMDLFGSLIVPEGAGLLVILTGWGYHFWNGMSFGMMYALVRPMGGWISGLVWGLGLQVLMMAVYPTFLQARLDDPGFLVTGIVGHSLWGVVLGLGVARSARNRVAE